MTKNGMFDDEDDLPQDPKGQQEGESGVVPSGAKPPGAGQRQTAVNPFGLDDDEQEPAAPASGTKRGTKRLSLDSKTFKGLGKTMKSNPKKTAMYAGVIVGGLLVVMFAIGVTSEMNKKRQPQTQSFDLSGTFATRDDMTEKLEAHMKRSEARLSSAQAAIKDQSESYQKIEKTLADHFAKQNDFNERQARRITDLENRMIQASKRTSDVVVVDPSGKQTVSRPASFDAAYREFIGVMQTEATQGRLTLGEARIRTQRFASENGVEGLQAAELMTEVLDKCGMLYVGDVAEQPISDLDRQTVHAALRPYIELASEYQYGLGATEGKVLPRADGVATIVRAKLGAAAADVGPEHFQRLALVARVRMENVTNDQEAALPRLALEQQRLGLRANDVHALEALIWDQRASLGNPSPGQHLALTWALARSRLGGGSAGASPATPDDIEMARLAGQKAIETAMAQGLHGHQDLLSRARTAIGRTLERLRRTASESAIDTLALELVAGTIQKTGKSPASGATTTQRPGPAGDPTTVVVVRAAERTIHLGPMTLSEANVGRAALALVPRAIEAFGYDPRTDEGASAVGLLWSAAHGVGEAAFAVAVDQPLSGKVWTDLVLQQFTRIAGTGSRIVHHQLVAQGASNETAGKRLAAIFLGSSLGPYALDHERADAAFTSAATRLNTKPVLGPAQMAELEAIPADRPWEYLARACELLHTVELLTDAGSMERLQRDITLWMEEQQTVVVAIKGHERLAPELRSRLFQEVSEGLHTVLPMIVGQAAQPYQGAVLYRIFRSQGNLYAMLSVAEATALDAAAQQFLTRYLPMMDQGTGGAKRLVDALQRAIPPAVQQRYADVRIPVDDITYIDVGLSISEAILPDLERLVIREVLHARVEPRVEKEARGLNPAVASSAIQAVHAASLGLVRSQNVGINDMDRMAIALTRIGLDAVKAAKNEGGPAPTTRGPGNQTDGRGGQRPVAPVVLQLAEVAKKELTGPPIGMRSRTIGREKIRVLPAFSFVGATVLGGMAPEISGSDNLPITLECDARWTGPGDFTTRLPKLYVGGFAKPVPGPSRIAVELKSLSYRFPDGRTIHKPINGFVVDNLSGMHGLVAQWKTNWEKVMPPAVAAGFLQGTAAALDSTGQSVSVTSGGSTTVADTNPGSTFERAVIGGASEAASIVGDYFRQFMDKVQPTVEAPNGQPVTVIIFEPVVFDDVDDAQWDLLEQRGRNAGF